MGKAKPYADRSGDGVTVSAQVDVVAVLDAWVAALESSEREIRHESELPYDREMIKQALLAGLSAAGDEERPPLEAAFLALAWFQPLTDEESAAIAAFDAEGDEEAAPAALETEETLAQSSGAYAAVLGRIERDARRLRAELHDNGFGE